MTIDNLDFHIGEFLLVSHMDIRESFLWNKVSGNVFSFFE